MKLLTVVIVILVVISCVQAIFPKIPKLTWKFEDSAEDGSLEDVLKVPKLDLFSKILLKKDKKKLKLEEKTEKFEDKIMDFLHDDTNAKKVFEKLQEFAPVPPPPPAPPAADRPCPCVERYRDECDDSIRYFS